MRVSLLRLVVFAAIALTAGIAFADSGVLYWMVDAGAVVNGADPESQGVRDYLRVYEAAAEGSWSAARVRVVGGADDIFLDLYDGNAGYMPGEDGIDFDTFGGVWGAGVPDGIQSPISSGTPEYSFILELGNVTDSSWTTVAQSSSMTYTKLVDAGYIHPSFDIKPPESAIWTPGSFQAVPEPSGGLLTLMGVALLALRRRRFGRYS